MIDVALLSVIRRWRLRERMAIREIACGWRIHSLGCDREYEQTEAMCLPGIPINVD